MTQIVTDEPRVAPARPLAAKRATSWVLFGSLAGGIGALLFQILGGVVLGEHDYQPIVVLWTIQYLIGTVVLYSGEAYVARALQNGRVHGLDRSIRVIGAWFAVFAVGTGILTYALRGALFQGQGSLALVTVALIGSYGAFFVIKGRMAGGNRFRSYGAATALESLGRILLAVPVLLLVPTTQALAWVMPAGPLLVAAWWLYDRRRKQVPLPAPSADGSGATTSRFLAATTTANAVSQTLLAAGPLVLIPLGASTGEVSVYFFVITAARVPLVFAIGGLLSRLLPPLTRMVRAGRSAALRRLALLTVPATIAIAAAASVVGYALGPWVLAFVFDITTPDRLFVGLTVFGALLATGSLLLNQLLIARGDENRMVVPWLAALATAALTVVVASGTPTLRVSLAFVAGELVALFGLLAAVLTAPALTAPPPPVPTSDLVTAGDALIDP